MPTEGKDELMNEWKLTQKGNRHMFFINRSISALREAWRGLTFKANVKEGGLGVVPIVTPGDSPARRRCGCDWERRRKRVTLCE